MDRENKGPSDAALRGANSSLLGTSTHLRTDHPCQRAAMNIRLRKFLGTVAVIGFLALYCLAAMALGSIVVSTRGGQRSSPILPPRGLPGFRS